VMPSSLSSRVRESAPRTTRTLVLVLPSPSRTTPMLKPRSRSTSMTMMSSTPSTPTPRQPRHPPRTTCSRRPREPRHWPRERRLNSPTLQSCGLTLMTRRSPMRRQPPNSPKRRPSPSARRPRRKPRRRPRPRSKP
jgi:hypothetical protein